jgi:YesN/AraC family two-component response regulator
MDWGSKIVLKPITGMMLDLNMPKKNGIQVV